MNCLKNFSLVLLITGISLIGEKSTSQPGTLDQTFGVKGKVITDFNKNDDYSYAMIIQKDGKILQAGYSGSDMSVCRYLNNGGLDTLFGKHGKFELNFPGLSMNIQAIALQSDKKIILGGNASNGSIILHRLNKNGSTDSTFGANGSVFYSSSIYDVVLAIKIQQDNKIVTAGQGHASPYPVANVIILHRFNSDGSIDATFGNNGDVASHFGDGNDAANDLVIQKDGKIVAGGFTNFYKGQSDFAYITLVRYNINGSLDSGFGINGIDTTFIGSPYDYGVSLALQEDQKIIASHFSYDGTNNSFALLRSNANGTLDSTFGNNGVVKTKISTISDHTVNHDNAYSVCIDVDGSIYQTGFVTNGTNLDFGLVKYTTNGTLDSSFGNNSKVITSVLNGDDFAEKVLLQSDSKIIVGGYSKNDSNCDFSVVRYNNENVLPVKLLNFTAQKQNNSAFLQWQTTNEINNSYFSIERSPDSKIFFSIGTKQGLNSAATNNYTFTDNAPLKGINYYRLKQADKDGKYSYSGIASVEFINGAVFAIAPNPATNNITVIIPASNAVSEIIIYDVAGKKVMSEEIAANITSKQININGLASGVYNVMLVQNGKKEIMKLVKK